MKKRWIGMMLMVAALAGTAQAALLAEFTFDTDAADTAGGHDGVVTSGTVAGGVLTLDAGRPRLPGAYGRGAASFLKYQKERGCGE